jgi:dihydrofolate synthase / folylpolyglutamate synthase
MSRGIDWMLGLPRFLDRGADAYKPGLERMIALLEAMGNPQREYRIAHVAGTNGKGSTASMIAAIGTKGGHRVGLHTSPHLIHITERMRIDGVPASAAWLEQRADDHRRLFQDVGPSFFEATVALSFLYFAEENVDSAVIEVGLGGRLDATNVVHPDVSVITSIALEHTDILGSTIEKIAREKAGIIKAGVPVVSGVGEGSGAAVIRSIAEEVGAEVHEPLKENRREFDLDLLGEHQQRNAALAVAAANIMWPELSPGSINSALRSVQSLAGLRGRLERVHRDPDVYADVSHNADGIAAALSTLEKEHNRIHVVIALMADKDARAVASVLRERVTSVSILALAGDRLQNAATLAGIFASEGFNIRGTVSPAELREYVKAIGPEADAVLLTGSHLVAAEGVKSFEPRV